MKMDLSMLSFVQELLPVDMLVQKLLDEMVRITKNEGYICFTVRKQEWEAAPYESIIQSLEGSKSWLEVERHTSDYNTQEGINCQLCLFQVTK